jgi:hypothetical protein
MSLRACLLPALLAVAAVVAPAAAVAATPVVTTGDAARVTQTSATLTGRVDPRGEATAYFFEYGTTTRFGTRTSQFPAGSGRAVTAAAQVDGLTPDTRYVYRLVARNPSGVTRGTVRAFRTPRQPLGVTLTADANPVRFADATTIRGTVTGTNGGGQPVVLQARGFPYTSPFTDIAGPVASNAAGNFAFPVAPTASAQYRVRLANRPAVDSPVLSLGVGVRISTYVRRRVTRGRSVQFSGTIRPARPGAQVGIQKRNSRGGWSIVGGTITRGGDADSSRWRVRVRIPRGGTYRVLVALSDGNLVSNVGSEVRIRTRARR